MIEDDIEYVPKLWYFRYHTFFASAKQKKMLLDRKISLKIYDPQENLPIVPSTSATLSKRKIIDEDPEGNLFIFGPSTSKAALQGLPFKKKQKITHKSPVNIDIPVTDSDENVCSTIAALRDFEDAPVAFQDDKKEKRISKSTEEMWKEYCLHIKDLLRLNLMDMDHKTSSFVKSKIIDRLANVEMSWEDDCEHFVNFITSQMSTMEKNKYLSVVGQIFSEINNFRKEQLMEKQNND